MERNTESGTAHDSAHNAGRKRLGRWIGCTGYVGYVGVAAAGIGLAASNAHAQSFTASASTNGVPGSALTGMVPQNNNIFVAARPFDGSDAGFLGTNWLDVAAASLGLPSLVWPEDNRVVDAISAGYEPLDAEHLWDVMFSVDHDSRGVGTEPNSVRAQWSAGQAHAADTFYTNPSLEGSNRLLATSTALGIDNIQGESNMTSFEVWDSRKGVEIPYQGFRQGQWAPGGPIARDPVFFSVTGSSHIYLADLDAGSVEVKIEAEHLGLDAALDDLDALSLDYFGLEQFAPDEYRSDNEREALFSLAPGSQALGGPDGIVGTADDYTAADIFYTRFDGTFEIAGPANINFPFDLIAKNMGLTERDNVDALDIIYTMTSYDLPMDSRELDPSEPFIPDHPECVPGDMDGNGVVDAFDVDDFELALAEPEKYMEKYPDLDPIKLGDISGDGELNAFDVNGFEQLLAGGGAAAAVPEPASLALMILGGSLLAWRKRHEERA